MRARFFTRRRAGFSLIESLFALAILAVVSGGVFTLFYSNEYGAILNGDQCNSMRDTQAALQSFVADMRSASGFATPDHTGGLRVTFASGPAIEYYQEGATLKRMVTSTGNPTTAVATSLVTGTGLSLTYYNSSMAAIAGSMDSTKYGQAVAVDVTVTLKMPHAGFGQVSRTTRIMLRNKMS